jgi:hypothetical protein
MPDNVADRLDYMATLRLQVTHLRSWRGSLAALSAHLNAAVGDTAKEAMVTAALGYSKAQIGQLLATIDAFYTDLATTYPALFYEDL